MLLNGVALHLREACREWSISATLFKCESRVRPGTSKSLVRLLFYSACEAAFLKLAPI
jgi:hypothetical protein